MGAGPECQALLPAPPRRQAVKPPQAGEDSALRAVAGEAKSAVPGLPRESARNDLLQRGRAPEAARPRADRRLLLFLWCRLCHSTSATSVVQAKAKRKGEDEGDSNIVMSRDSLR